MQRIPPTSLWVSPDEFKDLLAYQVSSVEEILISYDPHMAYRELTIGPQKMKKYFH